MTDASHNCESVGRVNLMNYLFFMISEPNWKFSDCNVGLNFKLYFLMVNSPDYDANQRLRFAYTWLVSGDVGK